MLSFADCTAPMLPEVFLNEYRSRRPAYFRGDPTRYAFLVNRTALADVLSRLIVTPGILRMFGPTGSIRPDEFLSPQLDANRERRRINTQVVERYLNEGATLSLAHCESLFDSVYAMSCMLSEVLLARVTATLFLVYQPDRPCGLHWDDRDMFVCQVAGRKRWPVYEPVYENPLFDPRRSDCRDDVSGDCQEFILGPGDSLYIPRGWAHQPAGIEGSSVHIAFAIATPTGADLLDWIKQDLLKTSADVRRDLPLSLPTERRHTYAARLRAAVLERLSDAVIDSYLQSHTLNVHPRPVHLQEFAAEPTALPSS